MTTALLARLRLYRETLARFTLALAAMVLSVLHVAAVVMPAAEPASIKEALQPFVDRQTLAGAVALVADKDKVLRVETVGCADVAAKEPMAADSLFWIASQSKSLTSTALMMLVDEGKVSIDDPVEKYLPEFKGQMVVAEQDAEHVLLKKAARPITVRDVMSHTSGLPFATKIEPHVDLHPLSQAVTAYAFTPLKSQPGAKYDYSNAGINVGGRIIEVVSGLAYEDFMEQRLFKPLGMKDTTLRPSPRQLERLAKCYKPNAARTGLDETPINQLTYPLSDRKRGPSPAGGYFSTAADVGVFCRMLLAGGVHEGKRHLSESAIQTMTAKQTGSLPALYGLGWAVGKQAGDAFGHGGACATQMSIDPPKGLVIVFMVQHQGFGGDGGKSYPAFKQAAEKLYGKK